METRESTNRNEYHLNRRKCPAYLPDLRNIVKWLKNENYDFKIKTIEIKPVPEPLPKYKRLQRVFKGAFQKSHSIHHGYLKWFAWNKIVKNADPSHFEEGWAFYERNIYVPISEQDFKGRVLPRSHRYTGVKGNFLIADVASEDDKIIIECGVTTSNNLILPLKSKAVNKIIWIPFPYKEVNSFWPDFNKTITAYLIQRNPTKILGIKK